MGANGKMLGRRKSGVATSNALHGVYQLRVLFGTWCRWEKMDEPLKKGLRFNFQAFLYSKLWAKQCATRQKVNSVENSEWVWIPTHLKRTVSMAILVYHIYNYIPKDLSKKVCFTRLNLPHRCWSLKRRCRACRGWAIRSFAAIMAMAWLVVRVVSAMWTPRAVKKPWQDLCSWDWRDGCWRPVKFGCFFLVCFYVS